MFWLLSAACDPSIPERTSAASENIYVSLEGPRLLRRISLDLRGVLPSIAELDAVEANP